MQLTILIRKTIWLLLRSFSFPTTARDDDNQLRSMAADDNQSSELHQQTRYFHRLQQCEQQRENSNIQTPGPELGYIQSGSCNALMCMMWKSGW